MILVYLDFLLQRQWFHFVCLSLTGQYPNSWGLWEESQDGQDFDFEKNCKWTINRSYQTACNKKSGTFGFLEEWRPTVRLTSGVRFGSVVVLILLLLGGQITRWKMSRNHQSQPVTMQNVCEKESKRAINIKSRKKKEINLSLSLL